MGDGYRLRSNCYCVVLPTTNAAGSTADTENFGYVDVTYGELYAIGLTIRDVALLFPEATAITFVGKALATLAHGGIAGGGCAT